MGPLQLAHVADLIADTIDCPKDQSIPLARLVYQKTEGNPLFVNMCLKSLYQDALIWFNVSRRQWVFDLPAITALEIAENVVDLMLARIRKLPSRTQSLLSLAAAIGNRFDVKTLSVIYEQPPVETLEGRALDLGKWNLIAGGWQGSGIYTVSSGFPYTIYAFGGGNDQLV